MLLIFIAGFFPWAVGMITFFYWIKSPPAPNDTSNRINNIISWWIGLTRPDVLGKSYKEFFQSDVFDNMKK